MYSMNYTPTCSVAMLVLWKFIFLWRSTKEVNMLRPTRLVVDVTEKSKEGGMDKAKGEPKLESKAVFDEARNKDSKIIQEVIRYL